MANQITYCPPIHECDACKEIIDAKCIKNFCNVPQACIKLKQYDINGTNVYAFFSCSTENIPKGCTKTYTVFDFDNNEVFSSSKLSTVNTFVLSKPSDFNPNALTPSTPYYVVEFIDCGECGSTESLNQCFEVVNISIGEFGYIRKLQKNCDCCLNELPLE